MIAVCVHVGRAVCVHVAKCTSRSLTIAMLGCCRGEGESFAPAQPFRLVYHDKMLMQNDACVPMVSPPYFLRFLEQVSTVRMDAVVSHRNLVSIEARRRPAQLQLAPRGLPLRGLTGISGRSKSQVRELMVDALFVKADPEDNHRDTESLLTLLGDILRLPVCYCCCY